MNKQRIIDEIVAQLVAELEALFRAARSAHAEATHEQSKPENKYDTRALEASYLAHGQSRQAAEIEVAIAAFESMEVRQFTAADPIDVGALVELENAGSKQLYFIGHKGGGLEVRAGLAVQAGLAVRSELTAQAERGSQTQQTDGQAECLAISVLTPQAPLGRQLQGRKLGDVVELTLGGVRNRHKVTALW